MDFIFIDRGIKTRFICKYEGVKPGSHKMKKKVFIYKWHPDGKRLLFVKPEKDSETKKEGKTLWSFETDDKELKLSHICRLISDLIWLIHLNFPAINSRFIKRKSRIIVLPKALRLTDGTFTLPAFLCHTDSMNFYDAIHYSSELLCTEKPC